MDQNRVFIRQTLHKLLPSSMIGAVAGFVFYDQHPRDKLNLDVTICTNNGEVLEYYQRELVYSLLVGSRDEVQELRILRNGKCELFYLIVFRDEIIILSRKENLQVHYRVQNVETYSIEDVECTGQACLKIIKNDDALPLVFDDNFNNITPIPIERTNIQSEELPIVKQLMKKLTEAKYTTRHNQQKYKEYVKLRQTAAISLFQKTTLKLDDSAHKLSLNEISNLLQVSVKPPVVKMCNKKVVIIIGLKNNNHIPIKEVCVLLNSESKLSLEHTTKVFENMSESPCWKEKDAQINSYSENTVIAVVDLKDLQFDVASRIEFEIAVCYSKKEKIHMLPVDSVSISPMDVMGPNFDILYCGDDTSNVILSILATSENFDLRLRHIKSEDGQNNAATLSDIFHTHLKMDKYLDSVAIHKHAPFHILYGVMVVFKDNVEGTNIMNAQVYTRCPSQVLALMHYMYDTVPYRIIATAPDYKITAINNDFSNYNENSQTNDEINYTGCATSVLNQTKIIKDYLNECMLKMTENRNPEIQDKIGKEVDLMALGMPRYLEFRNKILEESLKGIKNISLEEDPPVDDDMDCVVIE